MSDLQKKKILLKIIFNFLDVLNFNCFMFSGTFDDI